MGFSLEQQKEKLQGKAVHGFRRKAAVLCWFTASGELIPWKIKYEDEEGFRHTVSPVEIVSSDQKYYAGILARKYKCRAEFYGVMRNFVLMFYPCDTSWDIIFQQ